MNGSVASGLNDNHRRAIVAAFRQIDGLLADVEAASARALGPFSRFFGDLSPTQQDVVADYVAQIRGRMMEVLAALGISLRAPESAASWAIQTNLSFAKIAVQEIDPSRLTGYGPLGADTASFVMRANADLERSLERLLAYVAQGLGKDLSGRLHRLEGVPVDLPRGRREAPPLPQGRAFCSGSTTTSMPRSRSILVFSLTRGFVTSRSQSGSKERGRRGPRFRPVEEAQNQSPSPDGQTTRCRDCLTVR